MREEPRLTEAARDLGLEEAKEAITARGRERGFVTSDDLLEAVPVEEFSPEQVEEFLSQVEEHLRSEGIEVIEVPGDETDVAAQRALEVDLLKAPTNDPVRMYLKEIGKVPLLNAAQEVDLARRIEAGEFATALREAVEGDGKVDAKQLRRVVEAVVAIREHQLEKFGKVEGIGRDRITKSWKPKSRDELDDFLRRVERDGVPPGVEHDEVVAQPVHLHELHHYHRPRNMVDNSLKLSTGPGAVYSTRGPRIPATATGPGRSMRYTGRRTLGDGQKGANEAF